MDPYEEILTQLGMERTRENYLWVIYDGNIPDDLDAEDELQLPEDLRCPAP